MARSKKTPTGPIEPAEAKLLGYREGVCLEGTPLFFDAEEAKELCFISSAVVPGAHRHTKILTTSTTAELMRAMGSAYGRGRRVHEPQILVTPFGRPFSLGQLTLELFPSGYLFGASSILVEQGSHRIVYAGQLSLEAQNMVERLEARRCDVLVLPYPQGVSAADAPPEEEVGAAVAAFIEGSFDRRQVPVLLCSPLTGGPQLAAELSRRGIALKLHRHLFAAFRVALRSGATFDMSRMRRYRGALDVVRRPEALLWPASLADSPALNKLSRARRAVVGVRGADPDHQRELGCGTGFVLGPRGSTAGLVEYVKASDPSEVLLVGGERDSTLADAIAALGVEVGHLGPRKQLPLFG